MGPGTVRRVLDWSLQLGALSPVNTGDITQECLEEDKK